MKIISMLVILVVFVYATEIRIDKINRVYDGDTFYVDLRCSIPELCDNIPVRVAKIDTPEIRTTDIYEKTLGFRAKEEATEFLKLTPIILEDCVRGKYFRLVCRVKNFNGDYLDEHLIKNKLGVPYEGGTKVQDWNLIK